MSNDLTLIELCALADLPVRTVRYYIQQALVDRPQGETRSARYGQAHIEQLLLIKKWTGVGLSLDRIRELLQGTEPVPLPRARRPGTLEVVSRLHVAEGVELLIDSGLAGMSPEQVRRLTRGVMQCMAEVKAEHGEAQDLESSHPGKDDARSVDTDKR